MSVSLTGYGGYFTRSGEIVGEYNRVTDLYGSALTAGFEGIWVQFASSDQASVQGLPSVVEQYRLSGQQYQQQLVTTGLTASLLQVSDDTSVVPYTYPQSVTVLAAQMRANGDSVNRPTLGASASAGGSNLGDTVVAVSTVNQYGDPLDMVMAETISAACTDSSQEYQETIQFTGEATVPPQSYLWPGGSGANAAVSAFDPAAGGVVTDGGFANWSGNTPDDWTIVNGSAGVTVFKSSGGGVRSGTDAAQITSDGSSATQLAQDVSLNINTVYAVTFQAKINSVTATGTFRIALTDTNGTVLTDDAGNNLEYTRDVNGQIGTSYANFTAFFATPRQLPVAGVQVRVGTSVAATSGRVITFDLVGVVAATQLYNGGPFAAAVAGADPTAFGDTWSVAVTNSLGADSFVRGSDRLYAFRDNGIYWPSSNSPTVPDSLITH